MAKMLVIDTETGGLDPQRHSILSLAGVVWDNGATTNEIEILIVEPEIVADSEALKVNKIDLVQHKRNGVSPAEAMTRFDGFLKEYFGDSPSSEKISLAGHNIYFDVEFLRRLCRLAAFPYDNRFSHRVLDTAAIIRFLILAKRLPLSGAGATEAFDYFGIKFDPHKRHTALEDARATAVLISKLVAIVSAP